MDHKKADLFRDFPIEMQYVNFLWENIESLHNPRTTVERSQTCSYVLEDSVGLEKAQKAFYLFFAAGYFYNHRFKAYIYDSRFVNVGGLDDCAAVTCLGTNLDKRHFALY